MSSSMQTATRGSGVTLAAMLALLAGSATCAAATADSDESAALQPIEELQQLDEIWVRGKSLSDMIEDAEDTFFRRYNKINKQNDFDVVCDYLRLDRNSLAMRRSCLPYLLGHIGVGYSTVGYSNVSYSSVGYSSVGSIPIAGTSMCSPGYYITTDSGTYYSPGTCTPAFSSFRGFAPAIAGTTVVPRPVNADTDSIRREYVRNLMRAIYRDQDLLDKATTLASLYQQMKTVQEHYQKIKAEDDARKAEERRLRREQRGLRQGPAPRNNGPRI